MSSEAGVVLRVILDLTVIGAEPVRFETLSDNEPEACELADIHLQSVGRPPSAFVWLRPEMAARSVDYPDIIAKYGPPGTTARHRCN